MIEAIRGLMEKAVGFIGLGNMGEPFAQHLLDAGYPLHVLDVRADVVQRWVARGATSWPDPQSLASAVDVVFLSLPTPAIVETVALGERGLCEGSKIRHVVDLSTTGPDVVEKVAAALSERNVSLVDAPVSGGAAGARNASVAIMLACSPEDKAALTPMLEKLGRIYHVGHRPGLGQVMKLLNNLLSAGALLLSGEAAALGVKAGLDAATMIEVFNAGSGRNSATLDKYPKAILPGTFDMGFTNKLMYKDVSLCLLLAERMGLSIPTAKAICEEWYAAMTEVGPDADFTTIVRKSERLAGVEVRRRPKG
jgi:3-hydroxyisobutyrate dehydrogenase-like beta-hydroxyacid dehydrogenase